MTYSDVMTQARIELSMHGVTIEDDNTPDFMREYEIRDLYASYIDAESADEIYNRLVQASLCHGS